jgi:glycosyltransferase involved in cell wall biosynthesis
LVGEGISNSIMEYMALGKPVIATNSGGTNEIVINNDTGFLITDNKVEVVVEKIEYLLNNPEISRSMGYRGRERIKKYFSIEKMIQEFINLYQGK